MLKLADYIIAEPGTDWLAKAEAAAAAEGTLYSYIFAANGTFIYADRPGLSICIQIAYADVRGLETIEGFVKLDHPRVPANYLAKIFDTARSICVENGSPIEALFHLRWNSDNDRWRLDKPRQEATSISVHPLDDDEESSYALALIDLHSHHGMDGRFSRQDNNEEQGFRLYAVIGNILDDPHIRLRVGCYGYFNEIPAGEVFELPEGISECNDDYDSSDIDQAGVDFDAE